ncbi:MAG: tetratricopeptide repeat protein, partial [Candidatus Magnetominusculus sp. LBB02]|nr:tetratricopeptide repeat protein [Candidatus Magnetominusculus sp. LBB02]
GGSVAPLSSLTLALRLENVAISYVKYVIKLFYPAGLALMYRHPVSYPAWQIVGAVTVLLAVSIFALAHMRRRPWFFTGWFWYILTLLPTIGLVKVGISYMADRYTYMPFVGLFIILAMSLPERSKLTYAAASSATALIIICVTLTNNQLKYWRNGVTLFSRAAAVTKDSYFAYYSLGYTLNKEGRYAEAEMAFNEAAKIKPYYAEALLYLGLTRLKQDKLNESLEVFKEAIQARPSMAEAYNGAGVALMSLGRLDEAAAYFKRALAADSGDEAAILNLKLITSNKHMED